MNSAMWVLVACGGAAGSVLRVAVATAVTRWTGPAFPYGTLVVNVAGSLLIGVLYVLLVERLPAASLWRAGLMTGVLGGFTTFSAFSLETVTLLEEHAFAKAALYVAASVIICLGATGLGIVAARKL